MENDGEGTGRNAPTDRQPLISARYSIGEDMISVDIDKTEDEYKEWDDDIFVWDLRDLEYINKQRKKDDLPQIPIIKKHSEVNLGIRAHNDMTIGKSLTSVFIPHQNEFIFIWLYIGFAIYFWIQVGLIATKDESYGF
jgi:hypothetical protein